MKREHPEQRVEVWFEDETRHGQQGRVRWVWGRRGSHPRTVKQTEYGYAYLFGAVNPLTGQHVAMVLPRANTQAMKLFLAYLSKQIPKKRHVVLVLDNAGWHVAKKLTVPKNITLFPLPAYAPELNPVERVWLWLMLHYLCNRVYDDYDHLVTALCEAWQSLTKKRIKSLCTTKWLLGH